MAEILVGKTTGDSLTVIANKTQVYGLAGNDTLTSNGKSKILLVGGSGNDVLNMTGGSGTLSGGAGNDTFNLAYSSKKKISAVIEDIDPTRDKIVITYDGKTAPKLTHSISGGDVIWKDDKGYFNLTVKGSSDANDYYEGQAYDYIWDVLWIVNRERETEGLDPLTLSQGLMDGASIRAQEIVETDSHTRPDGTSCFTAVKKSYSTMGENLAWGQSSPEAVMAAWMNSSGHKANILTANFKKLGVGYNHDENSTKWKDNWVQMFGGNLSSPKKLSTSKILKTPMTLKTGNIPASESSKLLSGTKTADYIRNGVTSALIEALSGNDTIKNYGSKVTLNAGSGNDSIRNDGASVSINAYTGNDYIENYGSKVTIVSGAGNDYVKNFNSKVSVDSGKNNDFIINGGYWDSERGGKNVSINGGAGNDTITNHGNNSRLDGGSDNDLIYNAYRYYASGNTFYNSNSDDYNGNNTTIIGGSGNDTIKNRGLKVTIVSGTGNDYIENFNSKVSIDGGKNDDIIINGGYWDSERGGKNVSISGGEGNDTITNNGNDSRLNGGSGDDLIYNGYRYYAPWNTFYDSDSDDYNGNNTTILGGAGNDCIKGGKGNEYIIGGTGNDSLWGNAGADKFIYKNGDGNDIIFGFDDTDTLTLDSVNFKTSYKNNVVTIKLDEGSVTLKDFTATTFHINNNVYKISGSKFKKQ